MKINKKLTIKYIIIPAIIVVISLLVCELVLEKMMEKTLLMVENKTQALLDAEEKFSKMKARLEEEDRSECNKLSDEIRKDNHVKALCRKYWDKKNY